MTQTNLPAWRQAFQLKLMVALDAAWALIDASDDPAEIRRVRDKAKAIGELAAVARKVGLIVPPPRGKPPVAEAPTADLAAMAGLYALAPDGEEPPQAPAPAAAQVEHARRALEQLKAGRRGRL